MLLNDMHTNWNAADDDKRAGIAVLHTSGDGYWSRHVRGIRITELRVSYINEDARFGELCVHFNTDDWMPPKHGLIYSDRQFEAELGAFLATIGLDGEDVGYSEQGMQGDNYVSCDVGSKFLASWKAKYPEKFAEVFSACNE